MAIEEQIIVWSRTRPDWQQLLLKRIATGNVLTDGDYDELVADLVAGKHFPNASLNLEHLPQTAREDPPVTLVSIEEAEHVNALASDEPLTFEPTGMTIVYGDNGSGKSGYARLLKRITRARHHEEVLSDVFRDTSVAKPSASVKFKIGKDEQPPLEWPDGDRPELQRMLFYDGTCGNAYVASESDFPYRPSALFVMDGLIVACDAVRIRIDAKLLANVQTANNLPYVANEVRESEAGRFVTRISGSSSVQVLNTLIAQLDESSETIDDLRRKEVRLRDADTSAEKQKFIRQSEKLGALGKHFGRLQEVLGDACLTALEELRGKLTVLEEAANLLASLFKSEPLPGVGSSPWKALWESAKSYSEGQAYPGEAFPVVDGNRRCVLCQQAVEQEGRERLLRFDQFVKDDAQVRLTEAQRRYERRIAELTAIVVVPDVVAGNLKDLELSHPTLVSDIQKLLDTYEDARTRTLAATSNSVAISPFGIDPVPVISRLTIASETAAAAADELSNPDTVQQRLSELALRRLTLELLQELKKSRDTIGKEIARLKDRDVLEAVKSSTATGPITNKILDLSEESITEVVRDRFTRETERLRLERVTIALTRGDKGTLLHQPKLVSTRQNVALLRVLSEGEQTALGLAAFFTEAHLDESKSALILDDPVTSLDHVRRELVARRLTALAEFRQVIVFTHDASFVLDLKKEATANQIAVGDRTVSRSRSGERKPGACGQDLPWKAKDVRQRLDELRAELARITKEQSTWDEREYENRVALWAGHLSETWESIFSQEIVGQILDANSLEIRTQKVRILASFSQDDYREFNTSYSRGSRWAKRHDKSAVINYVAPHVDDLEKELALVDAWFRRVKSYRA
jgi:energy-coupling factor transporter ATP-binding protein EcfA2